MNFLPKYLKKIWGWNPGSEIRDTGSEKKLFQIQDLGPGVKKAPDPGSRIRIRNTELYYIELKTVLLIRFILSQLLRASTVTAPTGTP